jgi:hypothetical protein
MSAPSEGSVATLSAADALRAGAPDGAQVEAEVTVPPWPGADRAVAVAGR